MFNVNNIPKLIIPIILNFPIFLSIIADFIKDISIKHPKFLFGFFKFIYDNILIKIETAPKLQIQTLYFNSIIQLIQSLIFFGNVGIFNKIFSKLLKEKFIPTKFKLFLLFQNIIVIIFIFSIIILIYKFII